MVSRNDSKGREKTKVGLVQINNSFNNQNYFPYSVGILQAYAQKHLINIEKFDFLSPIYKKITVENAVKHLSDAEIVFFSTYVWNSNLSSEIAKKIKIKNPETTIIFGGCQVPRRDTKLFMANILI